MIYELIEDEMAVMLHDGTHFPIGESQEEYDHSVMLFDICRLDKGLSIPAGDYSYKTSIPTNCSRELIDGVLQFLMMEAKLAIAGNRSVKRVCERLSGISELNLT